MKKFISMVMVTIMMMVGLVANAQTQNNYAGSSKAFDNMSVGIHSGIQLNGHDWNAPQGAILGINVNKEITPLIGVTAEVGIGFNNTANWMCGKFLPDTRHNSLSCGGTKIEDLYTFVDGRINLTNAILGYHGTPHWVNVEGVVGIGYGHGYDAVEKSGTDALLSKAGLNIFTYLNKAKSWRIGVSPEFLWNITPTGQFDCHNSVFQLTANVTYCFKTSNGTHHFAEPILYDADEVNNLKAKNAKLEEELAKKPHTETVVKEVIRDTVFISPKIQFIKGSSVIAPTSRATVSDIADYLKDTGKTYNILGYASEEGDESFNLRLSQSRADAVKNALVNAGVSESKLNAIGKGETTQFGDNYEDNRIVIVENK